MSAQADPPQGCGDIPLPIVKLNRWAIVITVVTALALRQPLLTTALFLVIASAAVFGSRGSLIYFIGSRVFARQNASAETEDRRMMRFNNSLAAIMLGVAQIGFLARLPLLGWTFSILPALAAIVALSGFCFGCFLYYRYKLERYRLFGS